MQHLKYLIRLFSSMGIIMDSIALENKTVFMKMDTTMSLQLLEVAKANSQFQMLLDTKITIGKRMAVQKTMGSIELVDIGSCIRISAEDVDLVIDSIESMEWV